MQPRAMLKQLIYGRRPFYRGTFPYFEHDVHFPIGSHLFERVCREGIYEQETLRLVLCLVEQDGTYIDVGANIGLLSIPVLMGRPHARVISIEASPDTLLHLEKTRGASPQRDRWSIFGCAVGRSNGSAAFCAAEPKYAAFDGLKDTGRGGAKSSITVEMRTLDEIWQEAGAPAVSLVKIDVEGAEIDVLAGARALIEQCRPPLIIEWSALNLRAYGTEPGELLRVCREIGYRAFSCPELFEVAEEAVLRAVMLRTETFLLTPATQLDHASEAR